jgi:hypothetical protein
MGEGELRYDRRSMIVTFAAKLLALRARANSATTGAR